jgi:hypothetical protein
LLERVGAGIGSRSRGLEAADLLSLDQFHLATKKIERSAVGADIHEDDGDERQDDKDSGGLLAARGGQGAGRAAGDR